MEIEMELKPSDYRAFLFYYLYRVRFIKRIPMYVITGLLVVTVLTMGQKAVTRNELILLFLLAPVITLLAAALATWVTGLISAWIFVKTSSKLLGKQLCRIHPQKGIFMQYTLREAHTPWKDVFRFMESKNYFFVFTDRVTAYILPKRHFLSTGQQEKFRKQVQQGVA